MSDLKYDIHFDVYRSSIAVVRACKYCQFTDRVEIGLPNVGRGFGMREGNKARGRMIQHLKECHADKLKENVS